MTFILSETIYKWYLTKPTLINTDIILTLLRKLQYLFQNAITLWGKKKTYILTKVWIIWKLAQT